MDDMISRQAALEAIKQMQMPIMRSEFPEEQFVFMGMSEALRAIKDLPSVQPEIIRCKECKWWDRSEDRLFGYCMAMKHGYMSANWEIGIYRRYKGDFYCADAERRTDEAMSESLKVHEIAKSLVDGIQAGIKEDN